MGDGGLEFTYNPDGEYKYMVIIMATKVIISLMLNIFSTMIKKKQQ